MQDKWSQHAGLPLPATTSSSHPAMRYLSRLPIATLYLTMAIISTFVTKILIVRSEYKFTYPYVVDVIQLTVALLFMAATKRFFKLQNSMGNSWIAAKTVVPVSILYAAMMIIQPKFLTHIPFTSYPLYYALSIPISALYCHAKKIWLVELSTLALSGVYILGVWLASLTTTASTSSSKTGFLLGIMYAGLISAYGIQIKKKLEQLDIWSLLFWKMAIVLPVMCIVTLFSGELSRLSTVMFLDEAGFWLQMVLTGLMGLATAFALILLINETSSPVYQAFAINAKITAQSIVAAFVFRNPMSGTASFGTLVALAASLVALQNSCRLIENTHRAA